MAGSFSRVPREICPVCANDAIEPFADTYVIFSFRSDNYSMTRYKFYHRPLYCGGCGHIWNGTTPSEEELSSYYKDARDHLYEDYDIEKRLDVITRHGVATGKALGSLLDFGSNLKRSFHEKLEDIGFSVDVFDVSTNDLRLAGPYDVITCYFVLEHVLDPDAIIRRFRGLGRVGTVLIVEVPGTERYDTDFSGLMHEHMQHFQEASMERLCANHGFKRIAGDWESCSRPFGFVMVFECVGVAPTVDAIAKREDVKARFMEGRRKQAASMLEFPSKFLARHQLTRFSTIAFWGVNSNFETLRELLNPRDQLIIGLDLNGAKAVYLGDGETFMSPDDFIATWGVDVEEGTDDIAVVITATAHIADIRPRLTGFRHVFPYDPVGEFG
jgi:hypothetical protein